MEDQGESKIGHGEQDWQSEDKKSRDMQEERCELDDAIVISGGMEDWNGFVLGAQPKES